jgi:hypothetical protein
MITFGTNDQKLGDRVSASGFPSRGVADCYANCDSVIAINGVHGCREGPQISCHAVDAFC